MNETLSHRNILVAFDLDDTLYKEKYYVESGYHAVIASVASASGIDVESLENESKQRQSGGHLFDWLYRRCGGFMEVDKMVDVYRNHYPVIFLPDESYKCLAALKVAGMTLGLITDGRHVGQWNKIDALGLSQFFPHELISVSADIGYDKTSVESWLHMERLTPWCDERWYVGDNPRKDFMHANRLGWHTVMLRDNGDDIKSQDIDLPPEFWAEHTVNRLCEIPGLLNM